MGAHHKEWQCPLRLAFLGHPLTWLMGKGGLTLGDMSLVTVMVVGVRGPTRADAPGAPAGVSEEGESLGEVEWEAEFWKGLGRAAKKPATPPPGELPRGVSRGVEGEEAEREGEERLEGEEEREVERVMEEKAAGVTGPLPGWWFWRGVVGLEAEGVLESRLGIHSLRRGPVAGEGEGEEEEGEGEVVPSRAAGPPPCGPVMVHVPS